MAISESLLDELHDLLLAIAPELRQSPLYVLATPTGYPIAKGVEAYAFRSIDYAVRKSLIERSQWDGAGNTIVFSRGDTDRETLFGLALHECGHCLPWSAPPADCDPSEQQMTHQADLVSRWADAPTDPQSTAPPWGCDHDCRFVRRCLHLNYRAEQLGCAIPLPAMRIAGEQYGTSGAWRYRNALGNEPARMLTWDFAEIEAAEPPSPFSKLWTDDVAAWNRAQNKVNQKAEAA